MPLLLFAELSRRLFSQATGSLVTEADVVNTLMWASDRERRWQPVSEFCYFRNDRVIPTRAGWLGTDDFGDLQLALRIGRPYDGLIFPRL